MSQSGTRVWWLSVGLGLTLGSAGCRAPHSAGGTLPTASPQSAALPGAVNSADAPSAPAVAESRTADLVQYRDPAHGVVFRYPSVWRPPQQGTTGGDAEQPDFVAVAPKPLITQVFLAAGTYYAGTVLNSLTFSYTVQPHTGAASCAAIPANALQTSAQAGNVSFNGRPYREASGTDAGMCHARAATVDTTLRGTTCFIFERDENTTCPDVKTSTKPRPLTATEQRALQRHLDAVMESVQIDPAAH